MEIPEFKYLKIIGDVSVEPVISSIPHDPYPLIYLIMGPTGAGKSSFIEAFAGESQKLSISKDQLAGYTQTVTAYQLVNVLHAQYNPPSPVYLIDTPGFSDSKISEMEILNMVRNWSEKNNLHYSHYILYFTPITDTRLPGSRRRTFAMLKKLFERSQGYTSLIVITTMWNTVHNEWTRNRAESNFVKMRDETLKEFVQSPSTDTVRFTNTKNSALMAIDCTAYPTTVFTLYEPSTSPLLYRDLHARIEGALQEKHTIELDLDQPEVRSNADLQAILKKNWRENHKTLTKFIDQFDHFGDFPPDCVEAAQNLRNSITAANLCSNTKPRTLFGIWELEPVFCVDRSGDGVVQGRVSYGTADILKDRGRLALDASKHRVSKLFKRGE